MSTPPPPTSNPPQTPFVCLEVMVITVIVWISLWGIVDVLIRRCNLNDDHELVVYLLLGACALIYVWLWNGVDTCALL